MLDSEFQSFDISDYINGFKINIEDGVVNIPPNHIAGAIDEISFRLLPMNMVPYIPSTISPCKSSRNPEYLEHPIDAFDEYRAMGAKKLIMELKHMGSRAVIVVFRNKRKAIEYTNQDKEVIIYTRTGRPFFDGENARQIGDKIKYALDDMDYFDNYNTGFVVIDAEILPWNTKGEGLLKSQYIPVLDSSMALNKKLKENLEGNSCVRQKMMSDIDTNLKNTLKFKQQLENYCWDTNIHQLQIAPFHLLAHERQVFFDQSHEWHLSHFDKMCQESKGLFVPTPYSLVDLSDDKSMQEAVCFWELLEESGYEGAMLKTEKFLEYDAEGKLILPMMKVRGQDYLRIIYGINYDVPHILQRYKRRSVGKKRFLHTQELLLGIEGLKRFAMGEDFKRWHECVLATLCLTNEVTDHRL